MTPAPVDVAEPRDKVLSRPRRAGPGRLWSLSFGSDGAGVTDSRTNRSDDGGRFSPTPWLTFKLVLPQASPDTYHVQPDIFSPSALVARLTRRVVAER